MPKQLSESEVEESVTFARGAMAAAGHFIDDDAYFEDLRDSLRGKISRQEMMARIYKQVTSE